MSVSSSYIYKLDLLSFILQWNGAVHTTLDAVSVIL